VITIKVFQWINSGGVRRGAGRILERGEAQEGERERGTGGFAWTKGYSRGGVGPSFSLDINGRACSREFVTTAFAVQ